MIVNERVKLDMKDKPKMKIFGMYNLMYIINDVAVFASVYV